MVGNIIHRYKKYCREKTKFIYRSNFYYSYNCFIYYQLNNCKKNYYRQKKKWCRKIHNYGSKKSKDITIEYFLAYVLPLFAFDFTQWDQLIIFLIFYLSLGFLCVKHSYFTANIILEILKYNFYECSLKNSDGKVIEKYVISKNNLETENSILLKSINNEYMIEPKT